jgi:ATP-binding cassette subfamily B protein
MSEASIPGGSTAKPSNKAGKHETRSARALSAFHDEERLHATYDVKLLGRLSPFVRPHARYLVASIALLLVNAALAMTKPLLMRHAFDLFEAPDASTRLIRTGALLTLVLVVEQALAFPQMYAMQIGGARAMADLRDRTPVGRLVTRVTNDVDSIGEMFASGALNAIGDLVRLVAIVAIMLSLDWKMSLLAFAALPPVAIFVNWARRRIRDAFREIRSKTARMNSFLNVQAYAREEPAAAEFDEINAAYRAANNRSIVYDASLDATIELVSSVCIASVLWYAGVRVGADVSFGTLFAFVAYIDMFFLPIRDLSARYTLLQSAMAGAERVFELLDNQDEDAPSPKRTTRQLTPPPTDAPAFELEHVDFEYKPGAPVLHDVSLKAAAGEKIALVGATGAGKTTIASLLLRLYDVHRGTVRVGGVDVQEQDRDALRRRFAVVPQDVFLFPGSVASNIAAGDAVEDRTRVVRALQRIDALELFERREGGLDALVVERGANFSAGERQLIAFARALYRDPPIVVLDEATANVDSDTEARLQHAFIAATAGRTALIIAHRLSTIRFVDRIVVFHKGRVVEEGTHEALVLRGGVYAKLHRLQLARERTSSMETAP